MSDNPLRTIMAPRSIAIVGASNNPTKMGTIQYLNLRHSGFPGPVYPIHPKENQIFGVEAYPRIEDLPEVPDLAMLVVPGHLVVDMIERFGALGTRHAVIITAGFKETGQDGVAREAALMQAAQAHGLRFLGPNCMGLVNTHLPLNVTAAPLISPPGHLSIVSQSGTYITQTLQYLHERGVRLNKAVSVGNEASIDIVDVLEFLAEDPETKAIGMYIECIRRPGDFLAAARRITRRIPIIAQYVGGTAAGARSGSSHTGALAGPDDIYDGLFKQAGIIRAQSIEDVYRIGQALSSQPLPAGKRVAILTNSGGPGTAMADTLDRMGMAVPAFSAALQEKLQTLLPGHASTANPVDLTFHVDMTLMAETLPEALLSSNEVDALLIHGIMDTGWADLAYPVFKDIINISREDFRNSLNANIEDLLEMPSRFQKPVIISSFFGRQDQAARRLQDGGIPVFDSPEKAAAAMATLHTYRTIRSKAATSTVAHRPAPKTAQTIIDRARIEGWNEYDAKEMLRTYGVPTCHEILAGSVDAARQAAHTIGFPVAVKGCHATLAHKTERGLVHLDLASEGAVTAACESIKKEAGEAAFLVCEMVRGKREFIAGVHRHPGFPPSVLFGLGGIFAEALQDTAIRLAPLTPSEALDQIAAIRSQALLDAHRGLSAVDRKALADILVNLGQLALDFPQIEAIDLNPILIRDGQPVVVDALFVASL